jgi:hypothetical protein
MMGYGGSVTKVRQHEKRIPQDGSILLVWSFVLILAFWLKL